jgi:POT family proton-dependent oligopeptide transporter
MTAKLHIPPGELFGHPKGLYLLFGTEMWERFSYYGMRALLVLSLVAGTQMANPGFGWSSDTALKLYAWYTGLVFFTPLLGGWIADNYLGQRKAVMLGGLIMAAGQFALGLGIARDINLFYGGLLLMIVGNGLFKANISTMVGYLYPDGDARRDGAFTVFYMGINTGAFIAPLICSTLGEDPAWGWKFGYYAAGCGMLLSVLLQFFLGRRYLGDAGMQASAQRAQGRDDGSHAPLTTDERDRLKVIFMLFVFVVLFWAAFEQGGGLLNLYASEKTDRMLGSFEIPTGWYQSLNPLFVVLLGPLFSMLWVKIAQSGRSMPTPIKMMCGLLVTALGFVFMSAAVFDHAAHGKANMIWLVLAYLCNSIGELCISPVGLSMVTKLAPLRLASLMMGVWFCTNFVANVIAGYVGAYASQAGDLAVFGSVSATLALFAVMIWFLSGRLVEWMHGAEAIQASMAEPAAEH